MTTSPDAPAVRRTASPARRKQTTAAYVLITPFLILFAAFLIVPLIYSGYLSLFVDRLLGGLQFVGLENYARALTDPALLGGILRVLAFFVIQVPLMLFMSLCFALALDSGRVHGGTGLRLVVFLPYAVPGVIAAMMWGFLYGNNFGPIAQALRFFGVGSVDILSPETILPAIANIVTWGFVGYNMVVLYSALRAVPAELYEAAEIDGASQWRIAWSIKIPAIRPAIMLALIFSVIGSFQLFNEPNLLRGTAPEAISASFTPNMYAYNLAFTNQEFNYAAAVSVVLGVVIMVVSYVVQLGLQRKDKKS